MFQYTQGTCGACGEAIMGDHIQAFQMQWHLDHLLCNICQRDFSDGTQVCEGIDGYAYCPPCWQQQFCPACGTCGKPVVGTAMNALNKSYHPESCFICGVCKSSLEGKFYSSKTGDLLCEIHYFAETGRLCHDCQRPIIAGKVVTAKIDGKEVRYHRDHFNCAYCKKSLAGERYKVKDSKIYCPACHLQLFE